MCSVCSGGDIKCWTSNFGATAAAAAKKRRKPGPVTASSGQSQEQQQGSSVPSVTHSTSERTMTTDVEFDISKFALLHEFKIHSQAVTGE